MTAENHPGWPQGESLENAPFETRLRLATLNLMEDAAEERRRTERESFERQRAEQSLQRSERRLKSALATARMASWDWDPKTDIMTASETAAEVFGLLPGQTLHSSAFGFQLVHPDDVERRRELVQKAGSQGASWHTEFRVIRPRDRKVAWLEERAMASVDPQSGEFHMTGLVWDITARKGSEAALKKALELAERARREAEEAIRTKDRFLAIVSHELRTPLTPVSLATEMLLQMQDLSPRVRQELERIRRNVEIETRLIGDLLDLSRISCGKFELTRAELDLHDAVRLAAQVAEPDFQAKGQILALDLRAEFSKVTGDGTRLQQVFWNLLKNAAKFTPEKGEIVVRSENRDGLVLVEVRDNGAGIERGALPFIFEPFRQAANTASLNHGGLGLGLAIAKATVEAHGGSIVAESAGAGQGASFRVALPLPR